MILNDIHTLSGITTSNPQRARQEASQQFESIFAYQMLKSMADTIPDGGILEEDSGGKLYKDMFNMQAAQVIGQNEGLGIARIIQEQLLKLDGQKQSTADKY